MKNPHSKPALQIILKTKKIVEQESNFQAMKQFEMIGKLNWLHKFFQAMNHTELNLNSFRLNSEPIF